MCDHDPDSPDDAAAMAAIPEGTRNPVIDILLRHWPQLAALAFGGFLATGRGFILWSARDVSAVEYFSGSPCECHVYNYDPATEVVVVLRDLDGHPTACLSGWPTPQDAFEAAVRDEVGGE